MDLKGGKKNRVHQPLQTLATANTMTSPRPPPMIEQHLYSPVTELSLNLGTLSTGRSEEETPRRFFHASPRPVALEKHLSFDPGCCGLNSATPLTSGACLQSSALRRFSSMPVPLIDSPAPPCPAGRLDLDTSDICESSSSSIGEASSSADSSPESVTSTSLGPAEDTDETSQESGISLDREFEKVEFQFAAPLAPPPRRATPRRVQSLNEASPKQRPSVHFFDSAPTSPVRLRRSSLTCGHLDDDDDAGFLDLLDEDEVDNTTGVLPRGMDGLLRGPVLSQELNELSPGGVYPRRPSRDSFGLCDTPELPTPSKSRRDLFGGSRRPLQRAQSERVNGSPRSPVRARMPKRPERASPADDTPVQLAKRRRSVASLSSRPPLQRCHSEAQIKSALNRCDQADDLIGDFTNPHALPLTDGHHKDVKYITPETMAAVLNHEYDHVIESALVVDCRFPYEYDGGHIRGASNEYMRTPAEVLERFLISEKYKRTSNPKFHRRNVLIFHCEFSSERAPSMYRMLREADRKLHKETYPSLQHPEMYVLKGGYRDFFHSHKELCFPDHYTPMDHKDFVDEMKHFRAKSKSWAGAGSRSGMRKTSSFRLN